MDFIFVDETGDPGPLGGGASDHFGLALLHVREAAYPSVLAIVSQMRWYRSLFTEIKLPTKNPIVRSLLRSLQELACDDQLTASGMYIDKSHYGGRYLTWSDVPGVKAPDSQYLRNYLFRHLLEFHFGRLEFAPSKVELVMDRVTMSPIQKQNIENYLGHPPALLQHPFNIPSIEHITMADSRYVEGLQLAHVFTQVTAEIAKGAIQEDLADAAWFFGVACLIGQHPEITDRGAGHLSR